VSIRENKAAAAVAGGHWLHLDKRAAMVKGRVRNVTVAVCACGWESEPQTQSYRAVEAGVEHSADYYRTSPALQLPFWDSSEVTP
jgi:hypothetical protein